MDLNLTQAVWTAQIWRPAGAIVARWWDANQKMKRWRDLSVNVKEDKDDGNSNAGFLSAWAFTFGAAFQLGTGASEDLQLFVKIDADDADATHTNIEVYLEQALENLVCSGNIADGTIPATLTLTEQNSSGISGTVYVAAIPSADNDEIILTLYPGWQARTCIAAPATSSTESVRRRDMLFRQHELSQIQQEVAYFQAIMASCRSSFEWFFSQDGPGGSILLTGARKFLDVALTVDEDGGIDVARTGVLAALDDRMRDDTNAQTVAENTVSASAFTADGDNSGAIGSLTPSVTNDVEAGTLELVCVNEVIGNIEFEVRLRQTDPSRPVLVGRYRARMGQYWEDPFMGVSFTTAYSISEAGDGATQMSGWSVTGETDDNTNDGILYWALTNPSGTVRRLKIYKSSSGGTANLVAQGDVTGDGVVTCTSRNGSGLTVVATVAYTEDDETISANTIDLQPPKSTTSNGPDVWQSTTANDYASRFATFLALNYPGANLPDTTAGSETADDSSFSAGAGFEG